MRHATIKAATAVGLMTCSVLAQAALHTFNLPLSGAQEVPPNASTATGSGALVYDDVTKLFDMDLTVTGITRAQLREGSGANTTSIHIHRGAAGTNGGIVIDLGWYGEQQQPLATESGWQVLGNGDLLLSLDDVPLFQAVQGALNVTNSCGAANPCTLGVLENSLFTELLYVNVHTQQFPGGEIRAQIVPEPASLAIFGLGLAGLAALRRRIA